VFGGHVRGCRAQCAHLTALAALEESLSAYHIPLWIVRARDAADTAAAGDTAQAPQHDTLSQADYDAVWGSAAAAERICAAAEAVAAAVDAHIVVTDELYSPVRVAALRTQVF
jgi:hypothetical protein